MEEQIKGTQRSGELNTSTKGVVTPGVKVKSTELSAEEIVSEIETMYEALEKIAKRKTGGNQI